MDMFGYVFVVFFFFKQLVDVLQCFCFVVTI